MYGKVQLIVEERENDVVQVFIYFLIRSVQTVKYEITGSIL